MRYRWAVSIFLLLFLLGGCGRKTVCISPDGDANVSGVFVTFGALPGWNAAKAEADLSVLKKQCKTRKVASLEAVCGKAASAENAKAFFERNFRPFMLEEGGDTTGLMTGYYEPLLHGSRHQSPAYPYPLYAPPSDLIKVELTATDPDLKHRILRGRLEGRRLVPYQTRARINAGEINATALCYVSSDIDRFFLQVQGSGRVELDDNTTLFVGHTDRNGWPYRSIGKLMVKEGLIRKTDISLQSIRAYLEAHPQDKKRILDANPSYIFFGLRHRGATGTLGVALTPMHSVAVDRGRIPLGYPVYYSAVDPLTGQKMAALAQAQDTGSAIKGQVRADLFWGFGKKAEAAAGQMKSPLKLWLLVPKHD
jgi:membrane-bound lytic murein transglycosylase A